MPYSFERYSNVTSVQTPSFGPRGERLAFRFDVSGVPQVWATSGPDRPPEQLTYFEERVSFESFSPEHDELIFGMDRGGNEQIQLYRLDVARDGSSPHVRRPDEVGEDAITPLTGEPDARHRWGGWSSDGERFAFSANRDNPGRFDVYVQDRDATGDEAEFVAEGHGLLRLRGWSPDDDRLLVSVHQSTFDHELFVVDLSTGDMDHVTPYDGEARYKTPNWGPDGDGVYVATDQDSDTLYLGRLDLATGEMERVADGGDWNVEGVTLAGDTGRFVYQRNVEGFVDLTLGELTGETSFQVLSEPDLRASLTGASFTPDADKVAVVVNSHLENGNVFVVDVETGDLTRWTRAPRAGIPDSALAEPEVVRVESFDGLEVPGLFSVPPGAEPGSTPVLVDVHGGPAVQRRPGFNGLRQYLVGHGYAVYEPNVRGSSGYGKEYTHLDDLDNRMDAVADLRAGVEWLHDHPAVDPDRVAAMGTSYGGFMVLAALAEHPELWAAGVSVAGIANFVTFLENTSQYRRTLREAEYGSLEEDRDLLERISPINAVDSIEAPLLVVHGENDPRVPIDEAEQIAEQAAEHVPVETLFFEDEGHGFSKRENRTEAFTRVAEFLHEHV